VTEINDQAQIEEDALKAIAEVDVTVVDPVTGDCFKVVAGDPIPIGYAIITDSGNDPLKS
jgi:hypothetical protein